jgi:transcriptional regulator with XRE-family HTH domain
VSLIILSVVLRKALKMETPLRKARLAQGKTLAEIAALAKPCDVGGLSKIERGEQGCSPELAERLAKAMGHAVTEMQILYPRRYVETEKEPIHPLHTTHTRAANGDAFGTPLKRRAEDKIDEKESA